MIKFNYHTHTIWCKHATHNAMDMAKTAFNAGYEELGFSEHVAYEGSNNRGLRLLHENIDDYIKEVAEVKKVFAGKMKVFCGFECEYVDSLKEYYKSLLEKEGVDYLIFGEHFHTANKPEFYFSEKPQTDNELDKYLEVATQAINSGLFKYMAHPDWFAKHLNSWTKKSEEISEQLCILGKEKNIIFGFNVNGMVSGKRKIGEEFRYVYPYEPFWKIAAKHQVKTIIEADAHTPSTLTSPMIEEAQNWAKKLGLNIVEKLEIQ